MHSTTGPARLRLLQSLAIGSLLLAIGCVALALWAGQRQTAVQGPWGLAVLPGGQAWLSVDDELWRLDAQGHRMQTVPAAQAGLPGAAGILAAHPDGHLVAWARHSPVLHVLSADGAKPLRTIAPAWPADLVAHADNAIQFAFAPDGRVAIATGGGHAVALFGPQGQYLGRTPKGTYRFTNGLWWDDGDGGGWWTTDTNRFALVRLDGARMQETRRITLQQHEGRWRFLGLATPAPRSAEGAANPLGTIARLDNRMEYGHVVDVWPTGGQAPHALPPQSPALEPRALARLGDRLLVVDGLRFAITQYGADRQPQDWGDAAVRANLAARRDAADHWRVAYRLGLAGALMFFGLGLLLAMRTQRLQARARLAARRPALAAAWGDAALGIPGQPLPTVPQQLRLLWRGLAPSLPWVLLLALSPLAIARLLPAPPQAWRMGALVAAQLAVMAAFLTMFRALILRIQTRPEFEILPNLRAQRLLARPDLFWPLVQDGERPRETMHLGLRRWLVLTNQRLLVFTSNGRDASLLLDCPRGSIRHARAVPMARSPHWWQRMQSWWSPGVVHLSVELSDGRRVEGIASHALTAQRVAALLNHVPAPPADAPAAAPTDRQRALRQALASLLLPGLGQWLQRRSGTALLLFVLWCALGWPLAHAAWAAWHVTTEVAPAVLWKGGLWVLLVHAVAAWDAWQLRQARPHAALDSQKS